MNAFLQIPGVDFRPKTQKVAATVNPFQVCEGIYILSVHELGQNMQSFPELYIP